MSISQGISVYLMPGGMDGYAARQLSLFTMTAALAKGSKAVHEPAIFQGFANTILAIIC